MSWSPKEVEMNRIVAVFHLGTILMTCTALAQSGWFRVRGLQCTPHLGLAQFFGFGEFTTETVTPVRHFTMGNVDTVVAPPLAISYLYTSSTTLVCVTPRLANLMKILILLCFMVIIFSAMGMFLNLTTVKNDTLRIIQRNAILNIVSLLWILVIVGISYYITCLMQQETSSLGARNIDVTYEYGFFTITAAGIITILGAAATLISSSLFSPNYEHSSLIDVGADFGALANAHPLRRSNMRNLIIVNTTAGGYVSPGSRRMRSFMTRPICGRRLEVLNPPESDRTMLTPPPPYTP